MLPRPHAAFSEMAATRLLRERAEQDGAYLDFTGAGAYEHHIPAVVSQLAARGDFRATVTVPSGPSEPFEHMAPGSRQLARECHARMAALLALDVAASVAGGGAAALAEAVMMAVRAHGSGRRVLMPRAVHPLWRGVVRTLTRHQRIDLVEAPCDPSSGHTVLDGVDAAGCAALVIAQPNYFGVLEPVDALTSWAQVRGMQVIGVVNPLAMAWLKPPGEWGARGAEFAAGDAQPLGMPPSGSAGFIACRAPWTAHLPGNVACRVPPMAVAAYLLLMGAPGLAAAAQQSAENAAVLARALSDINGVERAFSAPVFHEFALKLSTPVAPVLHALKAQGILGGAVLTPHFPELGQSVLVCATETKTPADITRYAENMARIISKRFQPAPCAIKPARTL